MRPAFRHFAAFVFTLLSYSAGMAHEYWIEPLNFSPPLNEATAAHLTVGSDFKGQQLSYIPQFTVGYQITNQKGMTALEGMAGDRPALAFTPEVGGLNIITYQTSRNLVTFQKWDKFETYLTLQGMTDIIERHRARGLPESDFSEGYSRYAKSLIAVGGQSTGSDVYTGMLVELVALQNPYSLAPVDELSIQLLFEGIPLGDHQISIFRRDEDLRVERVRTDENGQIKLPLDAGTKYLFNAIKMVDLEGQGKQVWESYWASMTFEIAE